MIGDCNPLVSDAKAHVLSVGCRFDPCLGICSWNNSMKDSSVNEYLRQMTQLCLEKGAINPLDKSRINLILDNCDFDGCDFITIDEVVGDALTHKLLCKEDADRCLSTIKRWLALMVHAETAHEFVKE